MDYMYTSADCGAGKTKEIIKMIKNGSTDDKFLIAQPTKTLSTETYDAFIEGMDDTSHIKIINSDTNDRAVAPALSKALRTDGISVIFCTHHSLINIPNKNKEVRGWNIIIDEALEVHRVVTVDVGNVKHKSIINDYVGMSKKPLTDLNIAGDVMTSCKITIPKKTGMVDRELVNELKSIRKHSCLRVNKSWYDNDDVVTLSISGVVDPTTYACAKNVWVLSNAFESTLMYILWEKLGVNWIKYSPTDIDNNKRAKPLRDRIKVHYVSNETLTRTNLNEHSGLIKEYCNAILPYINEDFIYVGNKTESAAMTSVFKHSDHDGLNISSFSHGINKYQDYTTFIWLGTMKPTKIESAILGSYSITISDIIRAREYEMMYQSLSRTNIRDYSATKDINVFVADVKQAEFLAPSTAPVKLTSNVDDIIRSKPSKSKTYADPVVRKRFKNWVLDNTKHKGQELMNRFKKWYKSQLSEGRDVDFDWFFEQ